MSRYTYNFSNSDTDITVNGYNLFNGAENAGIKITRADSLSNFYLATTPFNERKRFVWSGMSRYKVTQKKC